MDCFEQDPILTLHLDVCSKAGLESLLDDIQTLSLQDYFDANAINLERLEDDDDNWSEPASSVVEGLALDF